MHCKSQCCFYPSLEIIRSQQRFHLDKGYHSNSLKCWPLADFLLGYAHKAKLVHKSIEYGHNKGDDIWCTNLLTMDILMVMTFGAQKLSGHILLNKKLRQKDRHQDK